MNTQDSATFDGTTLHAVFYYQTPQPHSEAFAFTACGPADPACRYWAAVGGETFGFVATLNAAQAALCTIENALKLQTRIARNTGWDSVYVIWKPKDSSEATWRRWAKKWSARTAIPTSAPSGALAR